jgi:hypothetical protein
MPVADQEEGKEACQLPEEDELDQVAGQHDPEHRAHEGEQEREEPRHRVFRRHVVARIKHHQEADAGDQHPEQPCEAVQSEAEGKAELGHPFRRVADHPAIGHAGVIRRDERHADQRDRTRQPRFRIAGIGGKHGRKAAPDEGKSKNRDEKGFRRHRRSSSFGRREHLRSYRRRHIL